RGVFRWPETTRGRISATPGRYDCARGTRPPRRRSALARLETRIGLADHEDLATATNDLAVTVTGLRRLQGGQDLHDCLWYWDGVNKPPSIAVPGSGWQGAVHLPARANACASP